MKVKFVPQNVEFEIKPGESVMHLAEDNGLYIKSVCRGVPSCAECRVRVVEGEANTFQPVAAELALIGSGWFIDRRRLSCQLQCLGDVTIDMSEQIAKQQGLIGGRKAKAAKALGDRVEDETVIRESTAGAGRSRSRDEDEAEGPSTGETTEPRENRQRDPRPPRSNVVIGGGPKPTQPQPMTTRIEGDSSQAAPSQGISPKGSVNPVSGGIQPRREGDPLPPQGSGAPQPGGQNGGGRSGRSRRGGRGRR